MRIERIGVAAVCVAMLACGDEPASEVDASTRMDAAIQVDGGLDASIVIDGGRDAAIATDASGDGGNDASVTALPACEGGTVHEWLSSELAPPLPRDDDRYRAPAGDARAQLSSAIESLAAGAWGDALTSAAAAGYVLCRGEDAERDLVLLRPAMAESGHATLAIDTAPTNALILEAPHPLWDRHTATESVEIFDLARARAVLISGTHRCGSDRPSGCTGMADACGTDAPVRESDMAHAVDSMFHAAHLALAAAYPDALVVSVHGFSDDGVSVSNGTTDDTLASSPSARIARALATELPTHPITTCNDFGDPDVPRDARMCGTTNVQGRALNDVAMECTERADTASDRFVHLEQTLALRSGHSAEIAAALIAGVTTP
ncbi:MAG: hypothetical protein M3Y87_21975 [Myxococcota bacterium]|nr:hypothetical protein [Myxococcota bacterium]